MGRSSDFQIDCNFDNGLSDLGREKLMEDWTE